MECETRRKVRACDRRLRAEGWAAAASLAQYRRADGKINAITAVLGDHAGSHLFDYFAGMRHRGVHIASISKFDRHVPVGSKAEDGPARANRDPSEH
jgi:hypothetical protein